MLSPRHDLQDGDALELDVPRARMVETQIATRGVIDPDVLRAMRSVPRHRFVPPSLVAYAHEDRPLGIGHAQTISQPYIVAYMTLQLRVRPASRVLEVGTGCGYQAAVLASLAACVDTVEIVPELARGARERLARLGFSNVRVHAGDGARGCPEAAPFDAIVVSCGARTIPPALVEQLAPRGRLICPVGTAPERQELMLVEKDAAGETTSWPLIAVRFVPLTGPGA